MQQQPSADQTKQQGIMYQRKQQKRLYCLGDNGMCAKYSRNVNGLQYCSRHGGSRTCLVEGCSKGAQHHCLKLCRKHYNAFQGEQPKVKSTITKQPPSMCSLCHLFPRKKSNKIQDTQIVNCRYCEPTVSRRLRPAADPYVFASSYLYNMVRDKDIGTVFCPNFLAELPEHCVVVEIDENQHARYDKLCEVKRQQIIVEALGKPTVFVRFNPSSWHDDETGKLKKIKRIDRHDQLFLRVREFMTSSKSELFPNEDRIRTHFLFYEEKNKF